MRTPYLRTRSAEELAENRDLIDEWPIRIQRFGRRPQTGVARTARVDRVGGGDGFAAGFFYGLLTGESAEEALKLGWAHGALLTTFPGDTTMATVEQVQAFAQGGSARIQR